MNATASVVRNNRDQIRRWIKKFAEMRERYNFGDDVTIEQAEKRLSDQLEERSKASRKKTV